MRRRIYAPAFQAGVESIPLIMSQSPTWGSTLFSVDTVEED
jgi:hypothetical protein